MVNSDFRLKRIQKRLIPLYLAAFCHGFVLWYAIEKLFMGSIGFNDAGIGVMVAIYSTTMLIIETPSGILADRWSRKGVLILASFALAVSSLLGGFSSGPLLYVMSAACWGVFYAFYSGTYDSIVYDTVQEETGSSDVYTTFYGRIKMADSLALVLGGLVGGVISGYYSMNASFFANVPIALLAATSLFAFREPQLHKAERLGSLKEHVVATFKAVLGRQVLLRLLAVVVALSLTYEVLYEFTQLWLLATGTQAVMYGPAFALVISSSGIAGYAAGRIGAYRKQAVGIAFALMLLGGLALTFMHEFAAIVTAQIVLGAGAVFLSIIFMRDLHDLLPSQVRAGASSAVSTVSRLFLIVLGLGFGVVSNAYSVFAAAWLFVALAVIAFACEVSFRRYKKLTLYN